MRPIPARRSPYRPRATATPIAIIQHRLIASAPYANRLPRLPVRLIRRNAIPASTTATGTSPGRLVTNAATA